MTTSDAARAALAWLATYGLHSTLFLGGAWVLCALRPPRTNRNRERLWKLALVGGLASATLQLALGARPVLGWIDWQTDTARAVQTAVELPAEDSAPEHATRLRAPRTGAPHEQPPAGLASGSARGRALAANEQATPMQRTEAAPDATPRRAQVPAPHAPRHTVVQAPAAGTEVPAFPARLSAPERWPGLILWIWGAGGLLGLLGLACSWTCLRRRMLGRRILVDGPLLELFERVRAQAGVRRRVRLSVSPRISTPFSTGLFRAEVCVPAAVLTTLGRAQQEALLAHELAHVVRRDPAWFGLGFLIEKLFFFQPLNRVARRQLSELAEIACDDWAVRWTGARLALASCLTEVAGWVVGERPRLALPPGLAGHRSRLAQRVTRLLDDRRSPASEPPTRWWPPLAASTLALAALAVPGVSAGTGERAPTPAGARPRPAGAPASATPSLAQPSGMGRPRAAGAAPATDELSGQRGMLESELALLEAELQALHAELEARALRTRFADALQHIDARMRALRVQQARARELLALLSTPNTPASAPEPPAEALPPTADPGDSR